VTQSLKERFRYHRSSEYPGPGSVHSGSGSFDTQSLSVGCGPPEASRAGPVARAHLAAARAPSHGVSRRSGDSDPTVRGRISVPPDPSGVSTPIGFPTAGPRGWPKPSGAPPALSRPFRGSSTQPRARSRGHEGRRPTLPLLGFRALRHTLGSADPRMAGGSLRRRVPRPGFGYPHRDLHRRPYRRARRRSVHGLPPSRHRSPCPAVPLSGPLPSWRWRPSHLAAERHARLQGLALGTGSAPGP
jgi:hypothetical protein